MLLKITYTLCSQLPPVSAWRPPTSRQSESGWKFRGEHAHTIVLMDVEEFAGVLTLLDADATGKLLIESGRRGCR